MERLLIYRRRPDKLPTGDDSLSGKEGSEKPDKKADKKVKDILKMFGKLGDEGKDVVMKKMKEKWSEEEASSSAKATEDRKEADEGDPKKPSGATSVGPDETGKSGEKMTWKEFFKEILAIFREILDLFKDGDLGRNAQRFNYGQNVDRLNQMQQFRNSPDFAAMSLVDQNKFNQQYTAQQRVVQQQARYAAPQAQAAAASGYVETIDWDKNAEYMSQRMQEYLGSNGLKGADVRIEPDGKYMTIEVGESAKEAQIQRILKGEKEFTRPGLKPSMEQIKRLRSIGNILRRELGPGNVTIPGSTGVTDRAIVCIRLSKDGVGKLSQLLGAPLLTDVQTFAASGAQAANGGRAAGAAAAGPSRTAAAAGANAPGGSRARAAGAGYSSYSWNVPGKKERGTRVDRNGLDYGFDREDEGYMPEYVDIPYDQPITMSMSLGLPERYPVLKVFMNRAGNKYVYSMRNRNLPGAAGKRYVNLQSGYTNFNDKWRAVARTERQEAARDTGLKEAGVDVQDNGFNDSGMSLGRRVVIDRRRIPKGQWVSIGGRTFRGLA